MEREIVVKGAREHNLRDVDLTIPHGKLICFTGVSGSGKSSLAFDTIYAEGQRRYLESLSSYARQFIGQLPKPDVDHLSGLSPSISISQKSTSHNPRSTVGTITEIQDFLRVLYARVGTSYCPSCDQPVTAQTVDQIVSEVVAAFAGQEVLLLAPVIRLQKGEHRNLFDQLQKQGFLRARVDGTIIELADPPRLEKLKKHNIELVVDRQTIASDTAKAPDLKPLRQSIEVAIRFGEGSLIVAPVGSANQEDTSTTKRRTRTKSVEVTEANYSTHFACNNCGISLQPPSPQLLSFNSPQGRCPDCDGLGVTYSYDVDLLIPNTKLSIRQGAFALLGEWARMTKGTQTQLRTVGESMEKYLGLAKGYLLKTSWEKLTDDEKHFWLHGTEQRLAQKQRVRKGKNLKVNTSFPGILATLRKVWENSKNPMQRRQHEKLMRTITCESCSGLRLNAQARHLRLKTTSTLKRFTKAGSLSIADVGNLSIAECHSFFEHLSLDQLGWQIASEAVKEIRSRLGFLLEVGLEYITLNRTAPTLSGGESQRIRLASQIGSGLVGVTYVLDEPSIGLHPRDNDRLINSLKRLRDLGNTLLVVEHDEDTMQQSDLVVDFGPGPGVRGGKLIKIGHWDDIASDGESLTGAYLSGRSNVQRPPERRKGNGKSLVIKGARHNNLKNVDVEIPLGKLVCITGVSGSGKSSLITDILSPALSNLLMKAEQHPGLHDQIVGVDNLDKIIDIDQSPIGRTPRSNTATYVKVFDEIRNLYAQLTDAKRRGYNAGRFSFNTEGGRCSACEGNGATNLDMEMLADIWVPCPVCNGKRYDRETLEVRFKEASIADALDMDVQDALNHFANIPKIAEKLQTLHDVGLDYIKLGQPSPTLSGGEAQRIKLAKELSRRSTGRTIFVLDEPTTGLHFHDISMLLTVLQRLVDLGNTVVVVEHNLDLIQAADWVIDLGLEGGDQGGTVIAAGTPETVAKNKKSYTAQSLQRYFQSHAAKSKPPKAKKSTRTKASPDFIPQPLQNITVQNAQMHNLKSVNVTIPRDQMTVFCGHSGSGKTSLAMDTIYAEGQRRYVESLSSYARQFVGQMPKPVVDSITGLSPAVALEQKNLGHTPRSTVGTVTEVYDYLRVLMARIAQMRCPDCKAIVQTQSVDQIVARVLEHPAGTRALILAPIVSANALHQREVDDTFFERLQAEGYARVRINGHTTNIDERDAVDFRQHNEIQVVVDRISIDPKERSRINDSVEQALKLGEGRLQLALANDKVKEANWTVETHSMFLACVQCGKSYEQLTPHHFSFNSQVGWCSNCKGLGTQIGRNLDAFFDQTLSLRAHGIKLWPSLKYAESQKMLAALSEQNNIDLDVAIGSLSSGERQLLMFGTGDAWYNVAEDKNTPVAFSFQYRGIVPALELASKASPMLRSQLDAIISEVDCLACSGSRVCAEAAHAVFREKTIADLVAMPLSTLLEHIKSWKLTTHEKKIAGELVDEIHKRLSFLLEVGLEYLTLGRSANTLSGGEAQRIRLAAQLGSGLCGVLYVLDEPTIGLHPRDNHRLISAMHRLRDHGNTLVVVEHDRDVIASSDRLCDFGPGSGHLGGEIVNEFTPNDRKQSVKGVTGPYLANRKAIPIPSNRRTVESTNSWLTIRDAHMHTLRHLDVSIPLERFTAVTGPSGSGKSSLINGILYPALARKLHRAHATAGPHHSIDGTKAIDKVVRVDQSPLGNSPSSTPATYTGVFDDIRNTFAKLPQAKKNELASRDFSFNVTGGRCEKCEGNGQCRIEMHFLPDVWVQCDSCHGHRYQSQVLEVLYRGKSINDVLNMSIVQAKELFVDEPRIMRVLNILDDVGLGYVSLGQAAPTLSGGEAQRVKLAAELARPATGRTLYLFDEPTTGLHFDDIQKLLYVFHRLVDQGNTVVVIEHNLDVIKTADWVIELGPEAGWDGGQLVFAGTPEGLVAYATSVASDNGTAPSRSTKKTATKRKSAKTDSSSSNLVSHTGIALQPVLAAGPYEQLELVAAHSETSTVGESAVNQWLQDPVKYKDNLAHLVSGLSPDELAKLFRGAMSQLDADDAAPLVNGNQNEPEEEVDLLSGGAEVASCIVDVMTEFEMFSFVSIDDDQFKVYLESNEETFVECSRDDQWVEFAIHVDGTALQDNSPPSIRASRSLQKSESGPAKNAYALTQRGGFVKIRFTLDSSSQLERHAFSLWLSDMAYAFQERHNGVFYEAD